MFSAVLCIFAPDTDIWKLITIILATVSSSIFFPLIVGYFYDKFKEKQEGESIWRVFKEFSAGGILRVYKDREESEDKESAVTDLKKAFDEHRKGKIKMIGVSLRVFFHQLGPFYQNIAKITDLYNVNNTVKIQALLCAPNSPEASNRAKIETPRKKYLGIESDISITIDSIQDRNERCGSVAIEYGCYSSASYCTLVMFPNKCYFSPNILSKETPVRLPMIVFDARAHGYKMLKQYFDYLWKNKVECPVSKEES